jgi:Regulator of chromosome condensation (RCC1) repeat
MAIAWPLRSDGTVSAWGDNRRGQLGDGTLTSHSTPERVTGLPVYIAGISASGGFTARLGDGISATGGFATVLGTDGTVWAWGDDSAGQLGNARSSIPVTRPVNTIGAGSAITQLSAGAFHVLALKSNGTALAWGSNGSGQLGNGTTTDPPARYRSPAWPTPRRWPRADSSASQSTPCWASWGHSRVALARLPNGGRPGWLARITGVAWVEVGEDGGHGPYFAGIPPQAPGSGGQRGPGSAGPVRD